MFDYLNHTKENYREAWISGSDLLGLTNKVPSEVNDKKTQTNEDDSSVPASPSPVEKNDKITPTVSDESRPTISNSAAAADRFYNSFSAAFTLEEAFPLLKTWKHQNVIL